MATVDENGILFAEDTDQISPLHTFLNTFMQSVSDYVSRVKATQETARTATRRWEATRNANDTVGANTTAYITSVSVPNNQAKAGVYLILGRAKLRQNSAIGNVETIVTPPTGTPTSQNRTALADSFTDTSYQEFHVVTADGAGSQSSLTAKTSNGSLTVLSGSKIIVVRVADL